MITKGKMLHHFYLKCDFWLPSARRICSRPCLSVCLSVC